MNASLEMVRGELSVKSDTDGTLIYTAHATIANAENTETFMTRNFYLYGSRDDIMKYIEDNKEEFCTIEDVRLSKLVG